MNKIIGYSFPSPHFIILVHFVCFCMFDGKVRDDRNMATRNDMELTNPDGFRDWMVDSLLITFAWLGILALAGSLIRVFNTGWQPVMVWETGVYVYVVILALFRHSLSKRFCAYSMIAASFLVGTGELMTWGLIGYGGYFLLLSLVLAVLLIGKTAGAWIFAAALVFIGALGMASSLGAWTFRFDVAHYEVSPTSWVSFIMGHSFFAGVVILGQSLLQDTLLKIFDSLRATSKSLQEEAAERRRTEALLQESEKTYREIFDKAVEAMMVHDPLTAEVVDVNQAFSALFGYTRDEALHLPVEQLCSGQDVESRQDICHNIQAANTNDIRDYELLARKKDGSQFWGEVTLKSAEIRGKPRVLATVRDITRRKLADQKLQKWAQIFENAGWGVVLCSADGTTLELMNPAFAKMHGYTVEELTGRPAKDVFAPEARKNFHQQKRITHEKGRHLFESKHIRKDGSIFPVLVDIATVKDDGNDVLHRVANVQDITLRKQAEERVMRLLDENRSLAIHLSQVEEEERKYLARELHDEAGQWLTATQAYAQAVFNLSENRDDAIHANIRRVIESVTKAHAAIGNVIRDLRPGMLEQFGLVNSLNELVRLWRQQNPGVVLELGLEGDLGDLDSMINTTIYRIVQEGLTNAAKYAGARHVTVRVERKAGDDELILSVVDDGKGMDLAGYCDRFGLRGMRERASAMGGELTISALPGEGVHIEARLPAKLAV